MAPSDNVTAVPSSTRPHKMKHAAIRCGNSRDPIDSFLTVNCSSHSRSHSPYHRHVGRFQTTRVTWRDAAIEKDQLTLSPHRVLVCAHLTPTESIAENKPPRACSDLPVRMDSTVRISVPRPGAETLTSALGSFQGSTTCRRFPGSRIARAFQLRRRRQRHSIRLHSVPQTGST